MDKSTTMPFSGLQRSPWRLVLALACLMFAPVVTASIAPSNSTTAVDFPGTLPLQHAEDSKARLAEVVPLTQRARGTSATGNLVYLQFSNRTNIAIGDIAYISCNQDDYSGFDTPQQVLEDAYQRSDFSGVIFYSTATNYCNYQMQDNQKMLQEFPMFSMTDKQDSASLLDAISRSTTGSKLSVVIHGRDGSNTTASNPLNQPNPLGPSPSTAVAMIILYSITGIITALFLVIIVTGAIRAHRHPERYGPRNVLGRPRQSRARGLGRAILDTIPIVKFGEKEPTKPADVELASTAASNQTLPTPEAAETTREAPLARVDEQDEQDEQQEGIAPAQPAMAAAATGKDNASHDDSLGCSICTEDFEMGQDLRVLPCDHKFHPECVDPWLLNVSGTCPLCRVDLRPVTSNASSTPDADTDAGAGADPSDPPPASGSDPPHRSAFRDILSLRNRPNATPQERIYYLRRLREQRRNRSSEASEQTDNALDRRRSKSMNVRLSGVFGARARGERSLQQMEESSTPAAAQQQQRNDDPSAVHETDARAGSLA